MKPYIYTLLFLLIIPFSVKSQGPVYALNLDGNARYVHVNDNNSLDLTSSGTLMAWVKVTTQKNYAGIFHKGDLVNKSDEAYSLIIDNNRNFYFTLRNASKSISIASSTALTTETWVHVAAVWNTNSTSLFVNGILEKTENSDVIVRNSTGGLNIGAQFTSNVNSTVKNYPFNGNIDEVKIFNTALTIDEIRQHMSRTLITHPASLVLYYNFNELPSLTISDKTASKASSNDGILTAYTLADSSIFKVISGAPIGDNSVYTFGENKTTLSISLLNRGSLTVNSTSGITGGLILYEVFNPTINGTLPASIVKHDDTYWGMFFTGNSGVKFDVVYDFNNNTNVIIPADMALISRPTPASTWINPMATLDLGLNTLTNSRLTTISEFALGATSNGALPVELLGFKLKCTSTGSLISWATASEMNNDYFTIEKSTDMKDWKVVTTIAGAFNSNNEKLYNTEDSTMSPDELTYYRLKQTDFDGQFKYFDVLSILCSFKNDQLEIIGLNVSDNKVNTIIKTNGLSETTISLLDMNGQTISSEIILPVKGANIKSIEIPQIKKGIYFLMVVQNGERAVKKIYLN